MRKLFKQIMTERVKISLNIKLCKKFSSSVHVDSADDKFFLKIKDWWDPNGSMYTLHYYNDLRIEYIKREAFREGIIKTNNKDANADTLSEIFTDLNFLDIGCGAGLLCESLARLGGNVEGLDSNMNSYEIAQGHLQNYEGKEAEIMKSRLNYFLGSVDNYIEIAPDRKFDVVTAMEVIEHVNSPIKFVEDISQLIRSGGHLILSTINKTNFSYLTAILLAEKMLGIIPEGTHDWNKFIPPEDLVAILNKRNFSVTNLTANSSDVESRNLIDLLEKELLEKKFISKPIDREILSKLDVIGFDLDHTLVLYNTEEMAKLLYNSFSRFLVEFKNYPKDILIYSEDEQVDQTERKSNLLFREDFVHKYSSSEVVLDFNSGNAILLDENKKVIKAFHGTEELNESQIINTYGESREFSEFTFESKGENYQLIFGNFEYHAVPLYLVCIHLYENGHMIGERFSNYKVFYDDIFEALLFNYSLCDLKTNEVKPMSEVGYFFPEFKKNPKKYLFDYSAKELLLFLKSKGKGVFFATNSPYEFADIIMKNTIGEDYLNYFDLGIYYAKKPSFFFENSTAEAFIPDPKSIDNKFHPGITADSLKDETIFKKVSETKALIEGNYKFVENFYKHLRGDNLNYLFVGDNFYADCFETSKLKNWESVAVHDHLSTGFIGSLPSDFKQMWSLENTLGNNGQQHNSVFFTKQLREKTLFTVSNVEAFMHLK